MEFSVPMALVDYIPVIFFAIAAVILMRDLYARYFYYVCHFFTSPCQSV
jgi:hypothetical protein